VRWLLTFHRENASFESKRFPPAGTTKNLSEACVTLRKNLTPIFSAGYTETAVFTLQSKGFKNNIENLSVQLKSEINALGNEDAYTQERQDATFIIAALEETTLQVSRAPHDVCSLVKASADSL